MGGARRGGLQGDAVMSPLAHILSAAIRVYRRVLGPLLPRSCRFEPTCSAYALEALRIHGALRGSALALKRIARCHPWNPGGIDRVPEKFERAPEGKVA